MFLGCGRKQEHVKSIHTVSGENANITQTEPEVRTESELLKLCGRSSTYYMAHEIKETNLCYIFHTKVLMLCWLRMELRGGNGGGWRSDAIIF